MNSLQVCVITTVLDTLYESVFMFFDPYALSNWHAQPSTNYRKHGI